MQIDPKTTTNLTPFYVTFVIITNNTATIVKHLTGQSSAAFSIHALYVTLALTRRGYSNVVYFGALSQVYMGSKWYPIVFMASVQYPHHMINLTSSPS